MKFALFIKTLDGIQAGLVTTRSQTSRTENQVEEENTQPFIEFRTPDDDTIVLIFSEQDVLEEFEQFVTFFAKNVVSEQADAAKSADAEREQTL